MKMKLVFIVLGVFAIGFSMNAYAMMGGGGAQSRQNQSGQTRHMHDNSQRYHTDQQYHSNSREQYRSDHGNNMDGDGRYGQEHFMDDDFFNHDQSHPIDHGSNGYDGHNAENMHDNGPQGH